MPRLAVSLVSEAAVFWWTPCVLVSYGSPSSRLYLAQVRIRISRLLLWDGVGLEGRTAVRAFWWQAVQGSCRSAIHFPFISSLTAFASCLGRWGGSCWIRIPPRGSEWIINVWDYVDTPFTALGSDPRKVRLELYLGFYVFRVRFVQVHFVICAL